MLLLEDLLIALLKCFDFVGILTRAGSRRGLCVYIDNGKMGVSFATNVWVKLRWGLWL